MTSAIKKPGEFTIKLNVESSVVDRKNVSLGGAKKPLKVKLNPAKSTVDKKQVRLGGAKAPVKK